jgi:GNAT superfamily N-acetyltransferase
LEAVVGRGKTGADVPSPPFRVRGLTAADFSALARYDWSPLVEERDTIYLFLTQDHARYCFAAEDERGGTLGYVIAARSAEGDSAFVFHVHVRPEHRGRGAGTALVKALESTARADGVRLLWLLAREKACGFYRRLGYAEADDVLHPDAVRYVRAVKRGRVMAKELVPA